MTQATNASAAIPRWLGVTATCEAEGEEGSEPTKFTIKRSARNAKKLTIADEDGNVMGEVARCK